MTPPPEPLTPQAALERLSEGNRRFVSNARRPALSPQDEDFAALASGQRPFATVLGCADSRVPIEILFDQDPGDLFVVRVAGNIAGPTQIGSIEFAAERLGTRLVVILGHSSCGAIRATLSVLRAPAAGVSRHLWAIADHIRPSLEPLLAEAVAGDEEELLRDAVRANIRATAAELCRESAVIDRLVASGDVLIAGAEYDLASGRVVFWKEALT